MNAQLADALPYRLNIPWQPIGETEDTSGNQRLGALIPQLTLPLPIRVRLLDIEHNANVV